MRKPALYQLVVTIVCVCRGSMSTPALAERYPAPPESFFSSNWHAGPVTIAPGDVLTIRFYLSPDLDRVVKVRDDGKISLPYFQGIDVLGQTPDGLQKSLVDLYSKELTKPLITVDIDNSANHSIYVTGEVQVPGEKELHGHMTLAMALAMAQVNQRTAGLKSVLLIRAVQSQKYSVFKVDGAFGGEVSRNLVLQPGDVLVVPKKAIVKMDDAIDQYVRQLLPATPNASATILWEPGNPVNTAAAATH